MVNEIKVSYTAVGKKEVITSSYEAFKILSSKYTDDVIEIKEMFSILLLNRSNNVLGFYKVSEGGMSATVVDPKIIFSVALKSLASSIILCHNHPSGALKASQPDIDITKKLTKCGELLDIKILDHIIMTRDSYMSFADDGLM